MSSGKLRTHKFCLSSSRLTSRVAKIWELNNFLDQESKKSPLWQGVGPRAWTKEHRPGIFHHFLRREEKNREMAWNSTTGATLLNVSIQFAGTFLKAYWHILDRRERHKREMGTPAQRSVALRLTLQITSLSSSSFVACHRFGVVAWHENCVF